MTNLAPALMMGAVFQESYGDSIIAIHLTPGVCARFAVPLASVPPEDRERRVSQFVANQRAALGESVALYEKMPAKERAIIDYASTSQRQDILSRCVGTRRPASLSQPSQARTVS